MTPKPEAETPVVNTLIESMLHGDGIPRCDEWDRLSALARTLEREPAATRDAEKGE